jgi:2-iminobutanoate/2-iminopropanoate deaminase
MKTYRNPANVHKPVAAYTHQIEISGTERLLRLFGNLRGKTPHLGV